MELVAQESGVPRPLGESAISDKEPSTSAPATFALMPSPLGVPAQGTVESLSTKGSMWGWALERRQRERKRRATTAMEQRTAAAPTELPIISVLSLPTEDDAINGVCETEEDDTEEYPDVEDGLQDTREELGRVLCGIAGELAVDVIGDVVSWVVVVVCEVFEYAVSI